MKYMILHSVDTRDVSGVQRHVEVQLSEELGGVIAIAHITFGDHGPRHNRGIVFFNEISDALAFSKKWINREVDIFDPNAL